MEKSLASDKQTKAIEYSIIKERDGKQEVKKGEFDLDRMYKNTVRSYNLVKSMPEQPIPHDHLVYLAKRYNAIKLGTSDVTSLWRSLGIEGDRPKAMHLGLIETKLREMEQAPHEARINMLLNDILGKHDMNYEPLVW
ncbi:MAG: hypothetical protein MZV63_15540 [Marinilabiliales bacterium]|nr:hypothetical protein [Marinilabiliales bacterium]